MIPQDTKFVQAGGKVAPVALFLEHQKRRRTMGTVTTIIALIVAVPSAVHNIILLYDRLIRKKGA